MAGPALLIWVRRVVLILVVKAHGVHPLQGGLVVRRIHDHRTSTPKASTVGVFRRSRAAACLMEGDDGCRDVTYGAVLTWPTNEDVPVRLGTGSSRSVDDRKCGTLLALAISDKDDPIGAFLGCGLDAPQGRDPGPGLPIHRGTIVFRRTNRPPSRWVGPREQSGFSLLVDPWERSATGFGLCDAMNKETATRRAPDTRPM